MPSRPGSGTAPAGNSLLEAWDTQVRRLFPPRDTLPQELPDVAGIELGHFEIESRIARGGMGTVFLARDKRLDRVVALKVLSNEQLRDPAAVQRFHNEARAAAKLDHENIARVYYLGEERGVHFIAFEHIRGTTVREEVATKGFLSADEAVNYTLQSCEALKHIEAAGLVHRDIKPSNLIVTASGRVKLVDLGLARNLDPESEQDLTVTGTTLGTFDYISPEQARNPRAVDIRSDIYSLGCTLYQMLTGSPPYPHGSSVDKLLQHSSGPPPDPLEKNPRIPTRLALVVQRMMAPNVNDRFPSPQALIDELVDIAEHLGLRASAPEGTIWHKPLYRASHGRWEQSRGWLIAFGLILIVAVSGDDVYRWYRATSETPGFLTGTLPAEPAIPPAISRDRRTRQPGGTTSSTDIASIDAPNFAGALAMAPLPLEIAPDTATARPQDDSTGSRPSTTTASTANTATARPAMSNRSNDSNDAASTAMSALPSTLIRSPVAEAASTFFPVEADSIAARAFPIKPAASAVGDAPLAANSVKVHPTTDAPPTAEPTAVPPTAQAAVTPFLLRGAGGEELGRFQTLEAACHAAKSGSVIDIDWDGPISTLQKPVVIQDKKLRIGPSRPGLRPALTFVASETQVGPSAVHAIEVINGSLELYDVDLRMEVDPTVYAEEWVGLALRQAQQVMLQRVRLTIANPSGRPAYLVKREMPLSGPTRMMPAAAIPQETELTIRDSLLTGDVGFMIDRSLESSTLRIMDSGVVVANDFLLVQGADPIEMDATPATEPVLRCEFDHLTCLAGQSVVRIDTGAVRDLPLVRVDARNSILSAQQATTPFLTFDGHQESDRLLQKLQWNGNWNVYGVRGDEACVVRGLWPLSTDVWSYPSLTQWQANTQGASGWDVSRNTSVDLPITQWELTSPPRYVDLGPDDLTLLTELSLGVANPAKGHAGDHSDIGFDPSAAAVLQASARKLP
ncbi:MAG: protein kinase [Planctomycetaceae bacterium]